MSDLKIGNVSFNRESLLSCSTIKEAQEKFSKRDKELVKMAYEQAKAEDKEAKAKAKAEAKESKGSSEEG